MSKIIETEVSFLGSSKVYACDPVELTGVQDEGVAWLAMKQAFIRSGKGLVQSAFLKRHPKPEGTTQAKWIEEIQKELEEIQKEINALPKGVEPRKEDTERAFELSVQEKDWPSAEEIWKDALAGAREAYRKEEGGKGAKGAAKAAMLASVRSLKSMGVWTDAMAAGFPLLSAEEIAQA